MGITLEGKQLRGEACTDFLLNPFTKCFSEWHNPTFEYLYSCKIEKLIHQNPSDLKPEKKSGMRRSLSFDLLRRSKTRNKTKFQPKPRLVLFTLKSSNSADRKMLLIHKYDEETFSLLKKPNFCCEIYKNHNTFKWSKETAETTKFSVENVTNSIHFSENSFEEISFEISIIYKQNLIDH